MPAVHGAVVRHVDEMERQMKLGGLRAAGEDRAAGKGPSGEAENEAGGAADRAATGHVYAATDAARVRRVQPWWCVCS